MQKNEKQDSEKIPFVHSFAFEYGKADQVAPGIVRIIANNPGPFTYTGSGTYLVQSRAGTGKFAVIDPGPDDSDHINAICEFAGPDQISHIFVTHTHRDHCGGARLLADKTGAKIYAYGGHPAHPSGEEAPALEEGADTQFEPDILLSPIQKISAHGWEIEAVWTPGHISNHLCFGLADRKILFTGDHIMGWATTVIIPPDGSISDYFQSLDILLTRNDKLYLPTHGAPIENPHRFVRAVRTHRRMRDAQIMQQLKDGKTKISDIVATIYADVDKRLHVAASLNVLAHLIGLVEAGRVTCEAKPSLHANYAIVSA